MNAANGAPSTSLAGKTALITGGAHRVGLILARAVARAGGDLVLHYGSSADAARHAAAELEALGARVHLLQADLADPRQADEVIPRALTFGPLYALVNNAAIFEPLSLDATTRDDWSRHMEINLTAPFRLSQAFAAAYAAAGVGRIVNILDWRALRPGADHFPYTISKAGLAALTRSLAIALAPRICVNGLALGAILPPAGAPAGDDGPLAGVPGARWARPAELEAALLFLLTGPEYITGEIIHLDGGRHLV